MKRKFFGLTTLLLFILFGLTGCNKHENETLSGSKLIVVQLMATSPSGSFSSVAYSDVLTSSNTVAEDFASVTVTAKLLNPQPDPEDITYYQSIIIKRIKVEYTRADGLAQQGKDVPYSFMQDVYYSLDIDSISLPIDFILVQHTAKLESPLYELRYSPEILKMEAQITIYSQDIGGKWLDPVTGTLSVWFGNFD